MVIHEVFGLNPDIRSQADRLAAEGYLALAPDLYAGVPWVRCLRSAFRQLHARSGPAFDTLDAARELLAKREDSTGKTGVIGFCMGGGFALLCAPRGDYSAASVNYGRSRRTPSRRSRVPARWSRAMATRTRWAPRTRSGSRPP